MRFLRNYTGLMRPENPWYLRWLNLIFPFTEHGEGIAAVTHHPEAATLNGAEKLSQPIATTPHGGVGAVVGTGVGIIAYFAVKAVFVWKTRKLFKRLEDDSSWAAMAPESVLRYARNNYYLLLEPNALARFLHYLRTRDAELLVDFLIDEPDLLRVVLQDKGAGGLRNKIIDAPAKTQGALSPLEKLENAAKFHPIINEAMRENGSQIEALQRSLWVPSTMGFPLTWDVRFFLGGGGGSLLGGLIGSAIGAAMVGTAVVPVVGTAVGLLLGGVLGIFGAHFYPKFAFWMNKKMRLDEKQRFILKDEKLSQKRAWYREAPHDVPLYARIFLGLSAGATLGSAVGTLVPGIGNAIGGFGGAIYGACVGAGLTTFSPHLFRLARSVKRAVIGESKPAPSNDTTPKQHWYSESQLDIPWYLRMFAGAGGGAALGGSIGAYQGFVIGNAVLPGLGGMAGAAAGAALGSAVGALSAAVFSLLSPAIFALGRKIKSVVQAQFKVLFPSLAATKAPAKVAAQPDLDPPLDVPWYVRMMAGSAGGATLGVAVGTVIPGVGNLLGGMIGAIVGCSAALLTPVVSAGIRKIKGPASDQKPQENVMKLPWFVKMFAGAAAGNLCGLGVVFILGLILTGPAAAAVAGVGAGIAAVFTITGAAMALMTPRATIAQPLTVKAIPMEEMAPKRAVSSSRVVGQDLGRQAMPQVVGNREAGAGTSFSASEGRSPGSSHSFFAPPNANGEGDVVQRPAAQYSLTGH